VKLVVTEQGSELAAELWKTRHPAASSVLSYPEGRAALAAARRAGRLSAGAHRRSLDDFEATHDELLVIGVDTALARHAGELAEELGLRGYDAVHLASALALGASTALVTWDTELARAGADVGCAVAPAP
jgi:predicted nucleic acid-binding protein